MAAVGSAAVPEVEIPENEVLPLVGVWQPIFPTAGVGWAQVGWAWQWSLPLPLGCQSLHAVLLGDGQVDQLILRIHPYRV